MDEGNADAADGVEEKLKLMAEDWGEGWTRLIFVINGGFKRFVTACDDDDVITGALIFG